MYKGTIRVAPIKNLLRLGFTRTEVSDETKNCREKL